MSDIEGMRYELGREAAQKGERLHESASEEYKRGYWKGSKFFGSNVTPRNFGKGTTRKPWICVCGCENRAYLVQCWDCGTRREYSEDTYGINSGTITTA